jgi:hypothetical protein
MEPTSALACAVLLIECGCGASKYFLLLSYFPVFTIRMF